MERLPEVFQNKKAGGTKIGEVRDAGLPGKIEVTISC